MGRFLYPHASQREAQVVSLAVPAIPPVTQLPTQLVAELYRSDGQSFGPPRWPRSIDDISGTRAVLVVLPLTTEVSPTTLLIDTPSVLVPPRQLLAYPPRKPPRKASTISEVPLFPQKLHALGQRQFLRSSQCRLPPGLPPTKAHLSSKLILSTVPQTVLVE